MPTYEVLIPWAGVSKGEIIKTDSPVNAAFLPNVKEIAEDDQKPEKAGKNQKHEK